MLRMPNINELNFQCTNNLKEFAEAVYNFALSAAILAAFIGILMHALYAFGLRPRLQRKWVRDWLAKQLRFSDVNGRSKWDYPFAKYSLGRFLRYLIHWNLSMLIFRIIAIDLLIMPVQFLSR